MFKSAAIVIGAYALSIVLVLATDPLLSRIFPDDFVRGRIPSTAALMASTALFIVVSIVCAWLCARFAPGRPVQHVLWFFAIGEAMGLAATFANWGKGWPHWYWLSWLLSWPISCYIGLLLANRRASHVPASVG